QCHSYRNPTSDSNPSMLDVSLDNGHTNDSSSVLNISNLDSVILVAPLIQSDCFCIADNCFLTISHTIRACSFEFAAVYICLPNFGFLPNKNSYKAIPDTSNDLPPLRAMDIYAF